MSQVHSPTLPIGYKLRDMYTIKAVLGQGGFGITYLAVEDMTDFPVVIKENYPEQFADRNLHTHEVVARNGYEDSYQWSLESFEKEARTLRKLPGHPNVVHVTAVFKAMNTAYIVMEQVEGNTLEKLCPTGTMMPRQEVEHLLRRLLPALTELHSRGIVHRDIKPGNIMLNSAGEPVLIDFGAARPTQGTHTATIIGTMGYAPLEQMSQESENEGKEPQPHWDIYALGASCYRLITGKNPGYVPVKLAADAQLCQTYGAELLSSIDKARKLTPTDRWQSAQDWLNALTCTSTDSPTIVPRALEPQALDYAAIIAQAQQLIDREQYDGVPALLRPTDENGDAQAQNLLGACYNNGWNVPQDYAQAVRWFRKAAEQGHAAAQSNLGACYYEGHGVPQDHTQAVQWYRKAAEQGNAGAQNDLGWCYYFGLGVPQDYTQAVQWFRKAAEQGNAVAQHNLGACYRYGRGVSTNREEAIRWYRKAAEQGDDNAQNALDEMSSFWNRIFG